MFKFKKIMFSLFACFGLFLNFNYLALPTVEASVDYNNDLAKAFNLSDEYMNAYWDKVTDGKYRGLDELHEDGALTQKEVDGLEKQLKTELAVGLESGGIGLGHVYPSDINNDLTIHFNLEGGIFEVVKTSGNPTVDTLVLRFIQYTSSESAIYSGYNQTGKLIQPTWKVKGNKIDLYVPYVYYPKETRLYLAKQLENKLEALTGKDYAVTFRTSKQENAEKYDGCYTSGGFPTIPYEINNVLYSIKDSDYVAFKWNSNLPGCYNGKYLAMPNAFRIQYTNLSDFAVMLADYYGYSDDGQGHRMALATFLTELYYCPNVNRIILDDYTITFRAGKILDIEDSTIYINGFNSGDLQ